jgi:CspA family cold shock protein
MQTGTIARLVTDRGFGFIAREGQDKDLFFHAKEVEGEAYDSLREGDSVTFEVVDGPKGSNAVKVAKVGAQTTKDDDSDDDSDEA